MDIQQEKEEKFVDKHDFYFEAPLYEAIEVSRLEGDIFSGDVDAYNTASGFDTTYEIKTGHIGYHDNDFRGFYTVVLTCKRKGEDKLRFFVYRSKELVIKLGQFPSLADIQFAEIGKKYDSVLPKEDLKNLKKAIGLVAHGAGAGSFVYLRRIFENLILATFKQNMAAVGVSEADFKTNRMEDKVEALRTFLPSQLLEMKSIYGILSKGVHELSEEECLKYFSPLKLSIELVLDQKIEEATKRGRDALVKKQLQNIHQELSNGETK
ncbi:hypothetical protein IT398_02190 [Candidatus Nomurabacteria bacterium]|nr:hypothetical protein [Candidatus Nomurabacteria bacterium]